MIIDIDDAKSIQAIVNRVSEGWFNPEGVYSVLKANGKTNSPDFWKITMRLLSDVSDYLGQTQEEFLSEWNQRCIANDAKIMGYHCTRHSNKEVFAEKGILPLSNETIKLFDAANETPQAKNLRQYRYQQAPGPYFLLSYNDAKSPENHFCRKGPEILLGRADQQVNVDHSKSVPLIIHCAIPYSILPDSDYYTFCILRAYFNFLDPEDESNNLFKGYSIDLKGVSLDPKYIILIEEL